GLPADSVWIDVASPFRAEQLSVRVVETISTRWQDRDRSLRPLVDVIARQYRARPGNYLSFFSSYDYLQRAIALLRACHPDIPVREQAPRMSEADQAAFLAGFTVESRAVGFAVLGGAFAEGVDLPGHRLIGAFIATLGLPQWSPFNEEIRTRMADLFGAARGYDYAYLYPGIRKVVQAAGRVIRAPTDEGVVYLLDDRFARAEVRRLLPDWWRVERVARKA
ncbi:MAG: helicase C-terminal domain-containing protein, partial [Janthinobacterium lividum]